MLSERVVVERVGIVLFGVVRGYEFFCGLSRYYGN